MNRFKQYVEENPKKMLIVGGAGKMGIFFTEFFTRIGVAITITDNCPNPAFEVDKLKKRLTNKEIPTDKIEILSPEKALENVAYFDIVMLSVPIRVFAPVVESYAPRMGVGSLLMDICSVKQKPVDLMNKYAPGQVDVLGTHPLFGPNLGSVAGQIVAFTEVPHRNYQSQWIRWLEEKLEENDAIIQKVTPKEHDELMLYIQVLTHFAYLSVARVFKSLDERVEKTLTLQTPLYEVMLAFIGRILAQNPKVYASIQKSAINSTIRDEFIKQCQDFSDIINEKSEIELINEIKSIRDYFRQANYKRGLLVSRNIVSNIARNKRIFFNSIGKIKGVRNVETGKIHVGVIERGRNDIHYDPYNIQIRGVDLLSGRRSQKHPKVLSLAKIEFLSDEEFRRWRIQNIRSSHQQWQYIYNISIILPIQIPSQLIEEIVLNSHNVINVTSAGWRR